MLQQHPGLYYAPSGKHRYGMYCIEDIAEESLIELCPVILIPAEQTKEIIKGHILYEYYFEWKKKQFAIALGYGSLYNHSGSPNAFFQPDYRSEIIRFIASEFIPAGKEILVDYHAGNPDEKVWFDVM